MNGRLQVLTSERDDVSRVVNEVRALLHTQTQESASLARQPELSTSRARDLTLEKDNLQQSLTRAHLVLPVLQEQLNQSGRKLSHWSYGFQPRCKKTKSYIKIAKDTGSKDTTL